MINETSDSPEAAHLTWKVYRSLFVYGYPEALGALISVIESRLADGWFRDGKAEQGLAPFGGQERFFLFARCGSATRRAVTLAVCADGCTLSVTNIFPDEGEQISRSEYNGYLIEFYLRFLAKAARGAGLLLNLSSGKRSFDWASAELPKKYSDLAYKLSANPADFRRWIEFLIELHNSPNRHYDFETLARWLEENGRFIEKGRELISECKFATDFPRLLRYVDRREVNEPRR